MLLGSISLAGWLPQNQWDYYTLVSSEITLWESKRIRRIWPLLRWPSHAGEVCATGPSESFLGHCDDISSGASCPFLLVDYNLIMVPKASMKPHEFWQCKHGVSLSKVRILIFWSQVGFSISTILTWPAQLNSCPSLSEGLFGTTGDAPHLWSSIWTLATQKCVQRRLDASQVFLEVGGSIIILNPSWEVNTS